MSAKNVVIGAKVAKLTILELYKSQESGRYRAKCQCECGAFVDVEKSNISSGNTRQCKACANITRSEAHIKHGCSEPMKDVDPLGYAIYTRWSAMKARCYRESDSHYKNYGGRGIKVCDRWLESYENFLADMGLPPDRNYQIDRIDNNGDYCPENCRWVSRKENARNKTTNKFITAFGETMTQSAWAEKTGIKRETIAMRLKRGWDAEKALTP